MDVGLVGKKWEVLKQSFPDSNSHIMAKVQLLTSNLGPLNH